MSMKPNKKPENTDAQPPKEVPQREIPCHRRCPICWGAHRGVGKNYSWRNQPMTGYGKRYYMCSRCGHTWAVIVKPTEIISYPEPEEIDER